jgi:molecular chaperone HscB
LNCWSCHSRVPEGEPFCPSCRKIQPVDPASDHFALLGLRRRYALDLGDLERRFREHSRQLHPDRFARAEPRERRLSLERTTRLNDALRTLRDDRRRAEYLLKLEGHDPVAEARSLHDPEFLEEQLEVREQLAVARAEGDVETIRRLGAEARARLARLEGEISVLFMEQEDGRERHLDIVRRLARTRYYDNVLADAEGDDASNPR